MLTFPYPAPSGPQEFFETVAISSILTAAVKSPAVLAGYSLDSRIDRTAVSCFILSA